MNAAAFAGDELVILIWGIEITTLGAAIGAGDFFGGMEITGSIFDVGVTDIFSFGNRKSEFGILPGGNASARKVSGATATWRTPRDFKPSRC